MWHTKEESSAQLREGVEVLYQGAPAIIRWVGDAGVATIETLAGTYAVEVGALKPINDDALFCGRKDRI